MNRKIFLAIGLLASFLIFLGACSDDDNKNEISEEWKTYQKGLVAKAMSMTDGTTGNKVYKAIESTSGLGYVHTRSSDFIEKSVVGEYDKNGPTVFAAANLREEVEQAIYDTDNVLVRYEGWYYLSDTIKYIFDSTESVTGYVKMTDAKTSGSTSLNGTGKAAEFAINKFEVDGFKTAVMDMKVGEERVICIPYQLGYKTAGKYDVYYNQIVPGYTTLFFDVKLLKVYR